MAHSIGENNPFLRSPGPGAGEIAARAAFYGAKVRSGARASGKDDPSEKGLYWSYGKKVWARCGGLGLAGPKTNSDRNSQLALYSPRSHLPILPLLTGISASNEGRMGSIVKATINFTLYPDITKSGVSMKGINSSFFRPGADISCSWGWSVAAAVPCAARFSFGGKVLSFSWSVNADVSVNASTSIMSAGAIATGVTGNLSQTQVDAPASSTASPSGAPTPTPAAGGTAGGINVLDAKQVPVNAADLGTAIDRAMAELNPIGGSGGSAAAPPATALQDGSIYGVKAWETGTGAPSNARGLAYCWVGIPWQPDPPSTDEVSKTDEEIVAQLAGGSGASGGSAGGGGSAGSAGGFQAPIVKKFWYVSFTSLEAYLTPMIISATKGQIKFVDIANVTNEAGKFGYMSAYPMEVIWGGVEYVKGGNPGISNGPGGGRGMNTIWFNTDYMKETWRKFFNENNNDPSQKNLTQFLGEISKRANEASGDFWQLSATVIDKFTSCGGAGNKGASALSVEDFSYCEDRSPFGFNASFGRPMLKNVSVSCQSSSTMGAAVMGGGNVDVPADPNTKVTFPPNPTAAIESLKESGAKNGINTAWGDAMKACLKMKKKNDAAHHSKARVLFPISFSVTVDGVSGLGFNEAIDTNLKPPGYGGTKFAINGISHSVSPETWETSINAMMRAN